MARQVTDDYHPGDDWLHRELNILKAVEARRARRGRGLSADERNAIASYCAYDGWGVVRGVRTVKARECYL